MKVSLKFVRYFLIILDSMQKKESSTRLNLIGKWRKNLMVGSYLEIGFVVVRFFILVTI